jgi:hypothetical protein
MVIDYDSDKTAGLTAEDVIEALSASYGTALRPLVETMLSSASFSEGVKVVARWEDADYSVNLVQSPYGSRFGVIAVSKHLDRSAQAAIADGILLDEEEAPERQKAEEQNAQSKMDKTRLLTKLHFRP